MYGRIKRLHFVGIGGIGMSGIAEVLVNMGYTITGSDMKESATVKRLKEIGAKVTIGHSPENVEGAGVVVVSSAVNERNPEVVEARRAGIPVIPRAQMLAELMRLRYGIAVAGSHGKTTTTSMISAVLSHGGLDPTIVVGGKVKTMGTNARLGKGSFMVVEADESDGSFLLLSPVISVLTNIDEEHLDHYKTFAGLEKAFTDFVDKVPFYGLSVLCTDCPNVRRIAESFEKRAVTYGFNGDASLRAENVRISGFRTEFDVILDGSPLGSITLNVPGMHNAQNALAAVAVGMELGMTFGQVKEGLSEFSGIDRRLQIKGQGKDVIVLDDYAHHPNEIRATLSAVKDSGLGRIVAIFQPHRYSRTRLLFDDFTRALLDTDMLYLLDIYPAGEEPIEGVSSKALYESLKQSGHKNVFYSNGSGEDIVTRVMKAVKPGDVVITLGAGNVWMVSERIAEEIG
ncbi:MAG: UDP-N-acetylmuramate--L-alanine ligase [Candidatus Dadabacteria bacterium]|nr:UDP-N-acetylmuramate--L-alanine ligase [Candidatus Dadabacteria bacterium]